MTDPPHAGRANLNVVTFDLAHGQVQLGEGSHSNDSGRAVIVPADALAKLTQAAGEVATQELGRALGRTLGERVARRLSGTEKVRESAPDLVTTELATELAMVGLGELGFERWGKALLAVVHNAPAGCDRLLTAVLEGALGAATSREVRAMVVARQGDEVRLFVGNVASIERVLAWLGEGIGWGDAITRLHGPRGTAGEVAS